MNIQDPELEHHEELEGITDGAVDALADAFNRAINAGSNDDEALAGLFILMLNAFAEMEHAWYHVCQITGGEDKVLDLIAEFRAEHPDAFEFDCADQTPELGGGIVH